MNSNSIFNELSRRVAKLSPEAEKFKAQSQEKIEQTLKTAFSEFGILMQEDFIAQTQALRRAESRIEELETLLSELEIRINKLT